MDLTDILLSLRGGQAGDVGVVGSGGVGAFGGVQGSCRCG